MKNFLFTILVSIALFGSQSCAKDTDIFIPTNTTTVVKSDTTWQEDLLKISDLSTTLLPLLTIEKLMTDIAADPTRHEISAERGGTITTPDNVTVEFPANSCTLQNNRPCTGNLTIEVLVLRKKGEFLLNNIPTVSLGKQLISGGAVRIRALQNGEELKLGRNMSYKVRFQPIDPTDAAMKLFDGKQVGRFNFIWTPAVPLGMGANPDFPFLSRWADTMQGRRISGYELGLDRFTWINCDKFSGDSTNLTNKFYVALADTFTNQNTSVFVVFKEINTVVGLIGDGKTRQFGVQSGYRGLPIGRSVTLISISTIKERIYISKKEVTIQANTTNTPIKVEPMLTTKELAKNIISNL